MDNLHGGAPRQPPTSLRLEDTNEVGVQGGLEDTNEVGGLRGTCPP